MTQEQAERLAIIVDPDLPMGLLAKSVALIAIGVGAVWPSLGGSILSDSEGQAIHNSANRLVPILPAPPTEIQDILGRAIPAPEGAIAIAFPQFARNLHDFNAYCDVFRSKSLLKERIEGLGLCRGRAVSEVDDRQPESSSVRIKILLQHGNPLAFGSCKAP